MVASSWPSRPRSVITTQRLACSARETLPARRTPSSICSSAIRPAVTPPSSFFWLGNAQYATRDYKEAIQNFRNLLTQAPDHLRAPEAVLSIANCQVELKDTKAARKTLEDLIKAYPQSEAAAAAKQRLPRLK